MTDSLSLVYFPAALALGALHALEPGHAKVLTASYLIGIKGTKRDSIILGLSVAATHSLVVIAISVFALWLGNEAFTGQAVEWLERGSGIVAITIGVWMLWRRLNRRFRAPPRISKTVNRKIAGPVRPAPVLITGEKLRFDVIQATHSHGDHGHDHSHDHDHHHDHDHDHLDDIAHAKAHAADLPDYAKQGVRPTTGQIIAFGAAGGMIPCPASITVMLLALAAGKTGMGLFTVMGFSIGLAVTLVGVGMVVVTGLSRMEKSSKFVWVSRNAPVISACLVIVSGLFALLISHTY